MDTPSVPAPDDEREREIMERLVVIRDELVLLKQDRTQYIRTIDVMGLYDRTIDEMRKLHELRKGKTSSENRDKVLESCLQLLSLFYMTIGRTSEAPAAYALTSTIKRLLDHLTEANLFSAKDLDSMAKTLENLSVIVRDSTGAHSADLLELLAKRIELCKTMLAKLQGQLSRLGGSLPAVHEKLISILRSLALANTRSRFSVSEVENLHTQLKEIDASRVDGKFLGADGQPAPGSDEVSHLLERILSWVEIVLERKGVMPEAFREQYEILRGIRNDLDKLSVTQAWSLRETDLYDFLRALDRIDEARVDGNWLDAGGQPAELYVQRTMLYLIRRSYGYIYYLMVSSEPVSEALLPIYNQLQTLKRCLVEVKNSGGVASVRELYPYSMKLNSIDNMRVEGKFMLGEDIPEGQGTVIDLLEECYALNYELRVEAEAESGPEA